ncbi:hypothetical protein GCM10028777_16120 [Angustibacter speluncae]
MARWDASVVGPGWAMAIIVAVTVYVIVRNWGAEARARARDARAQWQSDAREGLLAAK